MSPSEQHAALIEAHRRGDQEAAVVLATELARGRSWTRLVAATLVAYGAQDDRLADRAMLELARMEAVSALAERADSDQHWAVALAALVGCGRVTESMMGIRLAADEGRIGSGPWKHLVLALLEAGHYGDAIATARLAAGVHAADVELHALVALLACECGALAEAEQAAVTASVLDLRHPMVWISRARLAFARCDEDLAGRDLDVARALGADDDVIDWIGRLGRTTARYGV